MIRIDGYETDATGSDWFCYHATSHLIFPPGNVRADTLSVAEIMFVFYVTKYTSSFVDYDGLCL